MKGVEMNNREKTITKEVNTLIDAFTKLKIKGLDDDVIAYLSHMLVSRLSENYKSITEEYVNNNCQTVMKAAEGEEDYLSYFIFKVNADQCLFELSLGHCGKTVYSKRLVRAKCAKYYSSALKHNKIVHGKVTILAEVFTKISGNVNICVKALKKVSRVFYKLDDKNYEWLGDFTKMIKDYEKFDRYLKERK